MKKILATIAVLLSFQVNAQTTCENDVRDLAYEYIKLAVRYAVLEADLKKAQDTIRNGGVTQAEQKEAFNAAITSTNPSK